MTKSKISGLLFGGITLLVFILVVAAVLLFRVRPPLYPKAVHNACTGSWAIQTGFGQASVVNDPWGFGFGQERDNEALFWGSYIPMQMRVHFSDTLKPDTTGGLGAGWELTFRDSLMAIKAYHFWQDKNGREVDRQDSIQHIAQIAADKQRKAKDSIFKCQHTYQ